MPAFVIAVLLFIIAGFAAAYWIAARPIVLYLERRKAEKLSVLNKQYQRLQVILGELLRRADDIDQASKFLPPEKLNLDWHQLLTEACSGLVNLGTKSKAIALSLKMQDVRAARYDLLECTRQAENISKGLSRARAKLRLLEETSDIRKEKT